MPEFRVTDATLDVLEVLLGPGEDLYGLKIAKQIGRPTGSVFPILARLEECHWVASEWEVSDHAARGPRRRFYRLTPDGLESAKALLTERRGSRRQGRWRARTSPAFLPGPEVAG
jgi:PadR family transcriptional regulator, regulatory protein PadR